MLFELALNGIGGDTPYDVSRNLTMLQINQWAEYRRRRGSLNIGRRIEQTMANMMAIYINGQRKAEDAIEPLELMPHEDDIEIGFADQLE